MATVMVVDDVSANRDIVRMLLGYRGHEVIEAHDGADALRLAHEHHPDVVVSDVLMPGIDGLELVHRLRTDDDEVAAQAPVIFYTANYLEPETRPIAEACGVSQVVLRSQDPHELLDAVDAALAGGPVSIDVVPPDDFAQAHVQAVNAKLIEKVRALHHTERRFEAMAVASPVGIALVDADGEADYINPRLAEIMRTPIAGLLGRGWLACLDAPARRDALDLLLGNATERRFTHRVEFGDGTVRSLRLQLRHIQDDDAELAGGVLMVDDVSDVIAAEERLRDETQRRQDDARRRDAERLDSLRRMAGGAAHDFNNILGAILGYTSLAIESINDFSESLPAGLPESLLADLDQVVKGGERAKALTQQLLAFGRREITQPATFDVNTLLREMLDALHDAAGEATVVLKLAPGPADVRADPRQIGQVLVNLVANAADAMPGGGTISIATSAGAEGGTAVTVTDTGRGMPADVLNRAFEPFFTTKRSTGTAGLGLSTAHGIVSQAGGQLMLDSVPGEGTTATITLPGVRDQAAPPAPQPAAPVPPGGVSASSGGETLLLVDDEADLREVTARFLDGAGYRVLSAADAVEALNLLDRHHDPIAAMITDVVMPGMNGRQLARVAKQRRPDLRVVFVSGFAEALIDEAGNNLEPDSMIVAKPYTRDQLLAGVQSVLRQS
ncbi:response regulator [Paractinoplanes hotanensis]|uniref:histidine kinase n=1 Tax=Paractinoplanes hotanensis TaxID=2906497 RepID=A0ABT0XUV6_9ACTN|nr:response regulator [Actinoplanes hotanensis]MCM4077534.1 response regulator [Actinoplanes hotanensis]